MSRPELPSETVTVGKMFKALIKENPSVVTGIVGGLGMLAYQIKAYEKNRGRIESFSDYMIRSRVLVCATVVGCIVIEGGIKSAHYFYRKAKGQKTYDYHEGRRRREAMSGNTS